MDSIFPILDLPAELRNAIYDCYMHTPRTNSDPDNVNICFLNRQIRAEYEAEVNKALTETHNAITKLHEPGLAFALTPPSSFRALNTAYLTLTASTREVVDDVHLKSMKAMLQDFLKMQLPHVRSVDMKLTLDPMLDPESEDDESVTERIKGRLHRAIMVVFGCLQIYMTGTHVPQEYEYVAAATSPMFITTARVSLPSRFGLLRCLWRLSELLGWKRSPLEDQEDMEPREEFWQKAVNERWVVMSSTSHEEESTTATVQWNREGNFLCEPL
jgi:hypothetical protein